MTQPSVRDPQVLAQLDELVRHFGGDPEAFEDRLVRDIMQTALLLLREGADTGERKMIARSLRELRYALKVFRPHRAARKISIFGSARTPIDHADYQTTVRFGRSMAEAGWMVITGAGDGIMRAGHEG
ncbi:MAG: hypothetical protein OER86_11385, partial [Phycisphaerae bacterium]|nr:hypothetical protein [Phycisphaerae bacterium]